MRVLENALGMLLVAVALLSFIAPEVCAVTYYLAVDVPSTLGGVTRTTNQFVRSDNASYALELTLPAEAEVTALHRRHDGFWLFTPAHPLSLGGTTFEPRDVVTTNGATYMVTFDGSVTGVPDYARIDALVLLQGGALVMSFDVPVNLGGVEYSQSDLVTFSSGFSLFRDAEAAGVPAYANLVGAAVDNAGRLVVTFDVPVSFGSSTFLPGQLVRWGGGPGPLFSNYFADPSWPPYAQLRDFAFVPPAGAVPDGNLPGETPLTVTTAAGDDIILSWGASCAAGDNDYEIYEGTIGSYYSHASKFCTTSGATTKTFTPASGNTYYLVVPRNALREGSYGISSNGVEIPQGTGACLQQEIAIVCQ